MLHVCLTHDIDRTYKSHQYITKFVRSIFKLSYSGVVGQIKSLFVKHPYWGFNELIEIERDYNVRSTIFFLNESIKFNPLKPITFQLSSGRYNINSSRIEGVIRYLDANGWEIAVHGSYNSYRDKSLMIKEKSVLEEIVGHEIIGIRQHYAKLSEKTWQYQQEAGFKYDSSFGYTDKIGFKDDKITPFAPFNNDFYVIPLVVMDMCFVNRQNNWEELDFIMEQCENSNGVLVIDFHQHTFHEYDFPGYRDAYIRIIEKCRDRKAEFSTLSEIYTSIVSCGFNHDKL